MNAIWRATLGRIGASARVRATRLELALELAVAILAGVWWPVYVWAYIRPVYPQLMMPLMTAALAGWLWQGRVVWKWWRPSRSR